MTTDYDLYLVDANGNLLASSTNNNSLTEKPLEVVGWQNQASTDAIVYLGSDKASYLTGQIIRVNGGKTAA